VMVIRCGTLPFERGTLEWKVLAHLSRSILASRPISLSATRAGRVGERQDLQLQSDVAATRGGQVAHEHPRAALPRALCPLLGGLLEDRRASLLSASPSGFTSHLFLYLPHLPLLLLPAFSGCLTVEPLPPAG
jgi:hypothetical protein